MHTGLEGRHIGSPTTSPNVHAAASGLIITGGTRRGWLLRSPPNSSLRRKPDSRRRSPGGPRFSARSTANPARWTLRPTTCGRHLADRPIRYRPAGTIGSRGPSDHRGFRPLRAVGPRCRLPSGVEIMGSEGYLLNQFLALRTNKHAARGSCTSQPSPVPGRDPRRAVGSDSSSVTGCQWPTTLQKARSWDRNRRAGSQWKIAPTIINSGFSWHEAQRCAHYRHLSAGRRVCRHQHRHRTVSRWWRPTRINMPQAWNRFWPETQVADIQWPGVPATRTGCSKAQSIRSTKSNTCISCNQACLDHAFSENGVVSAQSTRRAQNAVGAVPDPARPLGSVGAGQATAVTPRNRVTGSRCSGAND